AELPVGKQADERACAVAERAGVSPGLTVAAVLQVPAQTVENRAAGDGMPAERHVRQVCLPDRIRIDQLFAVVLALAEMKPHPLCEIACIGADSTSRRLRIGITPGKRLPLPVVPCVERGAIGTCEEVGMAGTGRDHAERLVELGLGRILPAHAD